jgi:hypothetical protein
MCGRIIRIIIIVKKKRRIAIHDVNSNTSPDNSRGDVIIIVKKKRRIAIHHPTTVGGVM